MSDVNIVEVHAIVDSDFRLSFTTRNNHDFNFVQVRLGLEQIHAELSRILGIGDQVCPFREHKGNK